MVLLTALWRGRRGRDATGNQTDTDGGSKADIYTVRSMPNLRDLPISA